MSKMTHTKFIQILKDGAGQGHGENYKPWLWIHRKNVSPCSNQVAAVMPGYQRQFHFLARQEHEVALICRWLGVEDIREQFPIWPWKHPHPIEGAVGVTEEYMGSRGLLAIAKEADIDHGYYPGTDILYPSTLDLLLTIKGSNPHRRLIAIALKPRTLLQGEKTKPRLLERLELQRRYCVELNIPFLILDAETYPKQLIANLHWLSPSSLLPEHINPSDVNDFISKFNRNLDLPIHNCVKYVCELLQMDRLDGFLIFRHALWKGFIDINLTKPVMTSLPPRLGGALARQYFLNLLKVTHYETQTQ